MFKAIDFVEHLWTVASKKTNELLIQHKNGVTENPLNYLPKNDSNKTVIKCAVVPGNRYS